MTALICGSLAYDNIMVFPGRFKEHILPEKIHILNVCFVVPDMRREYGGCAGNIAYSMKLLGAEALPMSTVGKDFAGYASWLDKNQISRDYIKVIDDVFTAQCFITTDLDDNQISAFQVGAMAHSHENTVLDADSISIGIVAPDGKDGMLQHSQQFAQAGIPFIFDPGQNVPIMEKDELLTCFEHATWLTFNDYEWELVEQKTGLSTDTITDMVDALVVTLGSKGSVIYSKANSYEIPPVKTGIINDPTGCGDAYRAGMLYGLMNDMDWQTTGRIASLISSIKIEHHGTQNHKFEKQEFADKFKECFDYSL